MHHSFTITINNAKVVIKIVCLREIQSLFFLQCSLYQMNNISDNFYSANGTDIDWIGIEQIKATMKQVGDWTNEGVTCYIWPYT